MNRAAFQNIQLKLNLTNEGTAEALDVELFTVQQWACGTWPVPRPIVKFLRTLLSIKRDRRGQWGCGFLKGYDKGLVGGEDKARDAHMKGLRTGYVDGHREGLEAGRAESGRGYKGYSAGYIDGQNIGRSAGYTEGYAAAMAAVGIG